MAQQRTDYTMDDNGQYKLQLSFINWSDEEQKLFVEPWADDYVIPPKGELILLAKGPVTGHPSISYEDGYIIYVAWQKSAFEIYYDNQLLSTPIDQCTLAP